MLWIGFALIVFFFLFPLSKTKEQSHHTESTASLWLRSLLPVPKGNVGSVAPTPGRQAGVTLDCSDVE